MYLQHVSIPRPPGPESRQQTQEFFGRLLGLIEKPVPKSIQHLDLVWFQVGQSELHVFAEEPLDDQSGRHFCLVTEDVEGTRQKLLAAGYEPWNPEAIPVLPRPVRQHY
jgi:hypothetical protein